MLVAAEIVVTEVEGVSAPLLRFLVVATLDGTSSISKGLSERTDDKGDSSSLGGSRFAVSLGCWIGEPLV